MPQRKNLGYAGLALLVLCGAARAHAVDDFIMGSWARTRPECARPELTFAPARLDIAIDADGHPASFAYTPIQYQSGPERIGVELGKRHPYSKTRAKNALLFERIDHDTIALQRTRGGPIRFTRCSDFKDPS